MGVEVPKTAILPISFLASEGGGRTSGFSCSDASNKGRGGRNPKKLPKNFTIGFFTAPGGGPIVLRHFGPRGGQTGILVVFDS